MSIIEFTLVMHGQRADTESNDFVVGNLLLNNKDKWYAPANTPGLQAHHQQTDGEFILDLKQIKIVYGFYLINSNGIGSTKRFKVYLSNSPLGNWNLVLYGILNDGRNLTDPLPLSTFNVVRPKEGRFVKFKIIDTYGDGGGLKYFHVNSGRFFLSDF